MAEGTKTDNTNLAAKLDLRRYFLQKYHGDGSARVLDCCQGDGTLWRQLRREFPVASYWGVDLKKKPGRLAMDSARILAQPGWTENVIDIDTYGGPWKHWISMVPNLCQQTTVFLTLGRISLTALSKEQQHSLGLGAINLPGGMGPKLIEQATHYCLHYASSVAVRIIEGMTTATTGVTRYMGLRLEPIGQRRSA